VVIARRLISGDRANATTADVLGFGVEANVVIAVVEETFCVRVVLLPENKSGSVGT
jgi:hypothetical protein